MNKIELLLILLEESVGKCYHNDKYLIELGLEQASVTRIYYYMQEALMFDNRFVSLSKYNLDCEYNKKGQASKRSRRFNH